MQRWRDLNFQETNTLLEDEGENDLQGSNSEHKKIYDWKSFIKL